MARPFQAATTLSSRAGRTRPARRARSAARAAATASSTAPGLTPAAAATWAAERVAMHDVAAVEVAFSGHPEHGGGRGGAGPGGGGELVPGEGVEAALLALAVGVLGRGEPAPGEGEVGEQVVEGAAGYGGEAGLPGDLRRPGVEAGQQGVVVEHLLEVGHQPALVHGVAGEAAADLVVDAAVGHRGQGAVHHGRRLRRPVGAGDPQQELQARRLGELRAGRRSPRGPGRTRASRAW